MSFETPQPTVLEKINAALKELGSTAQWKKTPDFRPEYEKLKGKKVVMVEDMQQVIEAFVPELMTATDGNAEFVKYQGEQLAEVVDKVLAHNPDIVLLDYSLGRITGADVARKLREKFSGVLVGFSSDKHNDREFNEVGVTKTIEKRAWDEHESVVELARLV